jgi:hypothetical protein
VEVVERAGKRGKAALRGQMSDVCGCTWGVHKSMDATRTLGALVQGRDRPCEAVRGRAKPWPAVRGRAKPWPAVRSRGRSCEAVRSRGRPCEAVRSRGRPCEAVRSRGGAFLIWNMGGTRGAPTRERGVACPEVCGLFTDRACTVHTNQ